jgi:hypothetical protein
MSHIFRKPSNGEDDEEGVLSGNNIVEISVSLVFKNEN